MNLPRGEIFTTDVSGEMDTHKSGLYMQKYLAQEILKQFKHSNFEKVHEFKVDKSRYGKYDMAGIHQDDPEPIPRKWDPFR